MSEFILFAGSMSASAFVLLVSWWKITHAIAAENALDVPEWERI